MQPDTQVRLLPEWEPNLELLALWPFRHDVWRERAQPAQQQVIELLQQALQLGQQVWLGVHPRYLLQAYATVPSNLQTRIVPLSYGDSWARDLVPLWLCGAGTRAGRPQALHYQFDAWQGLYPLSTADDGFGQRLAARLGLCVRTQTPVFEGGNLTHDGQGFGLMVLPNANDKVRQRWRQHAHRQWGIRELHFVNSDVTGDETGGHIDNLVLFVNANTAMVIGAAHCAPEHQALVTEVQQLVAQWQQAQAGRQVIELPALQWLPTSAASMASIRRQRGVLPRTAQRRYLASYVNCVVLQQSVLVPQFGLPTDSVALAALQQQLTGYQVVPIAADEMVLGGGGPHCMTALIPAGLRPHEFTRLPKISAPVDLTL